MANKPYGVEVTDKKKIFFASNIDHLPDPVRRLLTLSLPVLFCHYRNQENSTDKERQTAKGCKRKLPVFHKHNHHNRNDRNKVRNQSAGTAATAATTRS